MLDIRTRAAVLVSTGTMGVAFVVWMLFNQSTTSILAEKAREDTALHAERLIREAERSAILLSHTLAELADAFESRAGPIVVSSRDEDRIHA